MPDAVISITASAGPGVGSSKTGRASGNMHLLAEVAAVLANRVHAFGIQIAESEAPVVPARGFGMRHAIEKQGELSHSTCR